MNHVVVCTDKRGVFFGELLDGGLGQCKLANARICIYWQSDVGGVTGLAATGPTAGCRIGAPAPELELPDVHALMRCSTDARDAWLAAPTYRG
jgi:hypothetical protein